MKSIRNLSVLALLVLVGTVSGCYTVPMRAEKKDEPRGTEPPYPFMLEITNHFNLGGASLTYYLTYDKVMVSGTNPHPSAGTIDLYSRHLDPEESERWSDFISAFPVRELDAEYVNRNVWDGYSRRFLFKLGLEEIRISVVNTHVEPLARLCDEVNRLVPPEMAVGSMHLSVAERLKSLQAFD